MLLRVVSADTCSSVDKYTGIVLFHRYQLPYTEEETEYWSTSCSAFKPSFLLYPTTVEEVSSTIGILNDNTEDFAIKSGGHNLNLHFSSISGGPYQPFTKRMERASVKEVLI